MQGPFSYSLNKLCRITANYSIGGNILGNNRTGSHHGIISDGYTWQDDSTYANPGIKWVAV